MKYVIPSITLLPLQVADVITFSDLKEKDQGYGDSIPWGDGISEV